MSTKIAKKDVKNIGSTNIRIMNIAKEKLINILAKSNDKTFGNKIKGDEIIELSLSLIEDNHIQKLQQQSMTEDDQEAFIFHEFKKENGDITKGEFKRLMFKGELTKFIKKLNLDI